MRNLKRALSLVMAMALIVGMMVISASAVSTRDFTDAGEIDHTEAVNTMVALNVISGKDDGSYFDPDGTLTRSEMAKVVAFVMNGGVEPNIGTKVIPTYSDIDNHWAEAYIEYCTSMGIIAGDGQGKFNPTGELTASQTAKMFLTAMGYNASVFGLVGADWETNTNRYANEAGLYENLGDIRVSDPISRDDMAQMAYNAIQAAIMERSWSQDITTGQITEGYSLALSDEGKPERTLFSERFGGVIYEGVLLSSGYVAPYSTGTTKDRLRIDVAYKNGNEASGNPVLNYAVDCTDMIGEYVKVLYNETGKYAYGVYTVEDETTVVINTTVGALSDVGSPANTLTYDGVAYDVEPGALAYVITADAAWTRVNLADNATGNVSDNANVANYDNIKLVDNNGDGILDVAFVVTNNISKVTYVGSDNFTLTTKGSVKNEDVVSLPELAVDDYVAWNYKGANYANKYVVTEASTMTGEVTEVGYNTTPVVNRILVDGTWYTLGQDNLNDVTTIVDDNGTDLIYNTTYDMVLFNDYVVNAAKVKGGDAKLAVITGTTGTKDYDGNYQVRLLLSDGQTVEGFMELSTLDGTKTNDVGKFVSYTIEDGVYKAVEVADVVTPGEDKCLAGYDDYDNATGTDLFDSTNKTLTGTDVATHKVNKDAIVFVWYDSDVTDGAGNRTDAFRVTNGEELNSWKADYGVEVEVLWNNSGLGYADVVYIKGADNDPTPGIKTNYGYITSAITEGSDASGVYSAFTIWDGTDSISVITRSGLDGASKGDVVSFDWDGATEIKNIDLISTAANTAALMFTNGEQVRLDNNGYDLADDVVIINIDSKNAAGVGGNAISTAAQTKKDGSYFDNCWYVLSDPTDPTSDIALLVIDVTDSKLSGVITGWDDDIGDGISDTGLPIYQ